MSLPSHSSALVQGYRVLKNWGRTFLCITGLAFVIPLLSASGAEATATSEFRQEIQPILKEYCYGCHGNGSSEGSVAFDELKSEEALLDHDLWLKVLKNIRAGLMPPQSEPRPSRQDQQKLEQWIKEDAFGLDPENHDPGRITLRRLNRAEYRNTIRDLLGVDFDVNVALPPDDVGYGFDNIGDVLSLSPMRIEKFVEAAMSAVKMGVPMDTVVIPTQMTLPDEFLSADGQQTGDRMSFYQVGRVSHRYQAKLAGDYRIHIAGKVDGGAKLDPQRVRVQALSDDEEFFQQEYRWSDAEYFDDERVIHWDVGEHELSFVTKPLLDLKPQRTKLDYRILYVRIDGPLDRDQWEHPPGYTRFYSREAPPENSDERRVYAREVLGRFVPKAFRRPVSEDRLNQLVALAERNYSLPGVPFEKGIAQAMIAVLASPRFLFHLETSEPLAAGKTYARVDEYTLASRLSYALWSSLPDEELTGLAARGELRSNFHLQVQRMLADPKAQAFAENFSGQWLQSRSILEIPINSERIMALETSPESAAVVPAAKPAAEPELVVASNLSAAAEVEGDADVPPARPRRRRDIKPVIPPGMALTPEIRTAMKQEVEAYFHHIVSEDRSVLELIQSDYAFVNEALAPVYGIPDISGPEMRRVKLPPGDLRGGVLTMGSVLTVTSNPTRTSPVKRGKWILENILGTPPAPPPPNIPALEDTQKKVTDHEPTQRELLALHREDAKCASCHERMDPLGLAMENFNAFGRGRIRENGQPIEPAGELVTGEKFSNVRELKAALIEKHHLEFYRTLTEKLLTYTLGRGMEYYDVPTVDDIVDRLENEDGRFSALLYGVLESAPFQQRRATPHSPTLTTQLGP